MEQTNKFCGTLASFDIFPTNLKGQKHPPEYYVVVAQIIHNILCKTQCEERS